MKALVSKLKHNHWAILLLINSIWNISWIASTIFVSTYLFKVSGSLETVAIYYLSVFIGVPAACLLTARQVKKGKAVFHIRLALILQFIYFGSMYLLGTEVVNYLVPIGFVMGLSTGCYCLPFARYVMGMPDGQKRIVFMSYEKSTTTGIAMTTPLLLGLCIWYSGSHALIFVILSALFLLLYAVSSFLQEAVKKTNVEYNLPSVLIYAIKDSELFRVLSALFFAGLSIFGPLEILIFLTIYKALGTDLGLGAVSSILPVIGIIVSLSIAKINTLHYGKLLSICAFAICLSTTFIFSSTPVWFVLLFVLVYKVCFPALDLLLHSYCYNIVDKHPELATYKCEYIILKEVALAMGRIVGFAIVLLLQNLQHVPSMWGLLLLSLSLGLIFIAFCLKPLKLTK